MNSRVLSNVVFLQKQNDGTKDKKLGFRSRPVVSAANRTRIFPVLFPAVFPQSFFFFFSSSFYFLGPGLRLPQFIHVHESEPCFQPPPTHPTPSYSI